MRINWLAAALIACCLTSAPPALAAHKAKAEPAAATQGATAQADEPRIGGVPVSQWLKSLTPRTGRIDLPYAKAALNLGDGYYFLGPEDTRKVLVDAWSNPPATAQDVLGMIFPKQFSPIDQGSWGAVVTFDPSGYVKDDDARTADYNALIEKTHKAEGDINEKRKTAGFEPIHLVGWAEPPSYDAAHHVLIWARDIKFGEGKPVDTLNYDIRVLGRRGVLSLNAVASMNDLAAIHTAAAGIQQTAAFDTGEAYADYKPGLDKSAGYGLAGLVAAGIGVVALKKIGLIGIILLFAKKGFAVIIALFAGLGARFRKLFGFKDKGDKGGGPPPPPSGGRTLNLGGEPPPSNPGGDIVS
jgi:uncharacterized membrane-anchored protein